jgi:hypothetical protein
MSIKNALMCIKLKSVSKEIERLDLSNVTPLCRDRNILESNNSIVDKYVWII